MIVGTLSTRAYIAKDGQASAVLELRADTLQILTFLDRDTVDEANEEITF
jgi:hypothetical protein